MKLHNPPLNGLKRRKHSGFFSSSHSLYVFSNAFSKKLTKQELIPHFWTDKLLFKRGQAAMEFSFMMSLGLLFMILVFSFTMFLSKDFLQHQREQNALHMAQEIQEELIIAATVHEGYTRTLFLPQSIGKFNYNIISTNSSITIIAQDTTITLPTPPYTGEFIKGEQNLTNEGGQIRVIS